MYPVASPRRLIFTTEQLMPMLRYINYMIRTNVLRFSQSMVYKIYVKKKKRNKKARRAENCIVEDISII